MPAVGGSFACRSPFPVPDAQICRGTDAIGLSRKSDGAPELNAVGVANRTFGRSA